jgi:hypothetical protein
LAGWGPFLYTRQNMRTQSLVNDLDGREIVWMNPLPE